LSNFNSRSIELRLGPGGQDECRWLLGGDCHCCRETKAGGANTGDDNW
jgi:hypothetical protein